MLTTWFASKERGTYWGLWNIAHNLGGFLAPIIAGFAAREFGWRWGMWVPGIMGIVMGFYVLLSTADSPESKGYPPVEVLDEEDEKSKDGPPRPHLRPRPVAVCVSPPVLRCWPLVSGVSRRW